MKYWSICAGVCAASQAWKPKGWEPVLFSEIDPKPCAVLEHRFGAADARHTRPVGKPALWGDFTALRMRHLKRLNIDLPDVIVGGTPCQDFSIAGARSSLTGSRGNLTLDFLGLCDAIDNLRRHLGLKPLIIIWENVPGVLNTRDNAFGHVLAGLAGCDTAIVPPRKWTRAGVVAGPSRQVSWRVLDAQYFGLAQRRERVFVVASAGTVSVAEILPEFDGLRRVAPPRREKGERTAPTLNARVKGGGGLGTDFDLDGGLVASKWPAEIAPTLNAHFGDKMGLEDQHALNGAGLFVPVIAFSSKDYCAAASEDIAPTLRAMNHDASHMNGGGQIAVAYGVSLRGRAGEVSIEVEKELSAALRASQGGSDKAHVATIYGIRRVTPRECDRLMGFEDDFTLVPYRGKPMSDSARYKMCGNSMAVPVMGWIQDRVIRAMELHA